MTFHELAKRIGSIIRVRIRSGPLKGCKWILSTSGRMIAGTYEPEKTRAITAVIRPGMTVVDVGAHVGYYSMIMAAGVGPEGRVQSFEPRRLNSDFLATHVRINDVSNIQLHRSCVGDRRGTVRFSHGTGTGTGCVCAEGETSVEMIALDEAIDAGIVEAPDLIKIDVEGAEMLVLTGAKKLLAEKRPLLVLAVHTDELERECRDLLEPMGYEFEDLNQAGGDREFLVSARVPALADS